jgi:hypothetical protein
MPGVAPWIVVFYGVQFLRGSVPVGIGELQPTGIILVAFCAWLWRSIVPQQVTEGSRVTGIAGPAPVVLGGNS